MSEFTQNYAKAEMLIRKPVSQVFEAFVDPAITTQFWFTKSSGRLDENSQVEWTWEMYNHTAKVSVRSVIRDTSIIVEWGDLGEMTTIEWTFRDMPGTGCFVSVINSGFKGNTDEIISQVRDSTEGFTLVLAALKSLLEHNNRLNLVADRFPKGL